MATMPSPRRLARQSISLLMQQGMSKPDAARVVTIICDEVTGIIWRHSPDLDLTWLADIANEAATIRNHHYAAGSSVQSWAGRVATWAREFDSGHAPRIEQREQADRRPGA